MRPILWINTTDNKEGQQLENRRNFGESSCNFRDGTDQKVQSLMFVMMMITGKKHLEKVNLQKLY
jgi:hypothetical protein